MQNNTDGNIANPEVTGMKLSDINKLLSEIDRLKRRVRNLQSTIGILRAKLNENRKDSKFEEVLSYKSLEEWFKNTVRRLQPKKRSRRIAILLADGDDFGSINEEYDHPTGDLFIKQTIFDLKSHIKKNDLVFRWGGDEFLIVLSGVQSEKGVEHAASRLSRISVSIRSGEDVITRTISVSGKLFTLTHKMRREHLHGIESELSAANKKIKEKRKNTSPNLESTQH